MKKTYLFTYIIFLSSLINAQHLVKPTNPFKSNSGATIKNLKQAPQDKGALIWSDDFSTPANWTITNSGNPSADWSIGKPVPTGSYSAGMGAIASTSGGNFAMFDSDALGDTSSYQNASITSNSIDLSGQPFVSVSFESYWRRLNDTIYLEVSTDSINFTAYQIHSGLGQNSFTSIPNHYTVNVSSVAGGSSAVWLRFKFTGKNDYAWMIDDIEIRVADDNDLMIHNGFIGFGANYSPYSRIPQNQIAPLHFIAKATNVGNVTQPNTKAMADINNGLFTGTSAPSNIISGATDSFYVTTQYTPPTWPGIYYPSIIISSDSLDTDSSDNKITFPPFEINYCYYAQDQFGTPGNGGGYDSTQNPPSQEFEAGNFFYFSNNDMAGSIEITIGNNTEIGTIIDAALYDVSTGNFVEVTGTRTTPYVVGFGDIGATRILAFPTPPILNAGTKYFAAVHLYPNSGEFYYGTSGKSPSINDISGATSLIYYPNMSNPNPNQMYYTTETPMVRLEVCPESVEEIKNKLNFTVYPNPSSTGDFTIQINTKENAKTNLIVSNVLGETIINKTIQVIGQTQETISLAGYSKGIYLLSIGNKTTKLIID